MAESVKRRVAAARLAVAFVAAGTIAGAGAWAQASPPPTAHSSILISSQKLKLGTGNIKNGSLLLQDFKAGEVASQDSFFKFKSQMSTYKSEIKGEMSTIKGELGAVEAQIGDIKGLQSSYLKAFDADARYIKMNDAIMGDGSVFNAIKDAGGQDPVPIVSVPNLINVDALPAEQSIKVTNTSGGNLTYSKCAGLSGGGTLAPGQSVSCATGDQADVLQVIGGSGVTTLNFSSVPAVQAGERSYIIAILVGM
jgi:hypothetical protein